MTAEMLDDRLLLDYMQDFYGYGNYGAPYWFVGIEEGGGGSFGDVNIKLQAWDQRGRKELEDLVDFHQAINVTYFFAPKPRIQATWGKLIRLKLSIEGREVSREIVRHEQANHLARKNGDMCLVELLPLPSQSTKHWRFARWSHLPSLQSHATYVEIYAGKRVERLKQRIEEHQPRVVVFYSTGWWYREQWGKIAGVSFDQMGTEKLYIGSNGRTVFAITQHPSRRGIRNDYFEQVGQAIADKLAGTSSGSPN